MLTDYALGAASLIFAVFLFRTINAANKVTALLGGLGFVALSIAAVGGGTYHGLALQLSQPSLKHLWNVTMISIGASAAFIGSAIHAAMVRRRNARWIIAAAGLSVVGLIIQATGFRHNLDFNHNDAFHVLQIGALYLVFRGIRPLKDRAHDPR